MSIGVVIVCYNTPEHIERAVKSVYDHVNKVVVVDNSEKTNECYRICDELAKKDNVNVIHTEENIGHGKGLNIGIKALDTGYIICMDSDSELLDPSLIKDMQEALNDDNVYGSGRVLKLGKLPYLHLPFCMFKKETFEKHHSFIHHGAPFVRTMQQVRNRGLKLVQVDDYDKRLFHEGLATRKVAGWWRKGFNGKQGI